MFIETMLQSLFRICEFIFKQRLEKYSYEEFVYIASKLIFLVDGLSADAMRMQARQTRKMQRRANRWSYTHIDLLCMVHTTAQSTEVETMATKKAPKNIKHKISLDL